MIAPRSTPLDFNLPKFLFFRRPDSYAELLDALDAMAFKKKGVLVLDPADGIGTDTKFQVDAKVLVLNTSGMTTDEHQQFISRGARSLGVKEGFVFFVADQSEEDYLKTKLNSIPSLDLLSAGRIFRMILEVHPGAFQTNAQRLDLNKALEGGLKQHWATFFEGLKKNTKALVTTANSAAGRLREERLDKA